MRSVLNALFPAFLLALATAGGAGAATIGHDALAGVPALPQATFDAIGGQRWLFTHASVGGNILDGMAALHGENASRYRLTTQAAGDWSHVYPAPSVTTPGTIYDGARGNPGWAQKFAMFDDAVRDLGWRAPLIDAAMDKLCYIDPDADVSVYLASMTALEADFPATRFVYVTMPLQSGSGADGSNVLATTYNRAVRQHCAGAGRLLFDLADIECHDPDGNAVTFTYQGQAYERLYAGYTSDGGHLNAAGARRAALGWYATAAALVGGGSAVPPGRGAAGVITGVAPNPFNPATVIRFRLDAAAAVDVSVYDSRGRRVARLFAGELAAGEHALAWNALGQPSGTYLARLVTRGGTSVRKLALVR